MRNFIEVCMNRIEKLLEYLESSPGDSFLKHALALEYIKAGNETAARQLFETILIGDPAYVGSYYHLAKLLERTGQHDAAIDWYRKGMDAAQSAGDHHAFNELKSAYEELIF